jgi:hypothetical protein
MTNADEGLYDAHLKTALEQAPDHHAQASEHVRKQVLDYAKQATKSPSTWFNRLKNWLLKNHFANAQWAGFTGVTAMLLVAVLLWRQHPEDTVWISATPKKITENSPTSAATIAQTQGDISQDSATAVTQAPSAPINAQSDHALQTTPNSADNKPANLPTLAVKKLDRTNSQNRQAKESTENEQLAQLNEEQPKADKKEKPIADEHADANIEAPVAAMAAQAPVIMAKPAAAEATSEPLSKQRSMVKGITDKNIESPPISIEDGRRSAIPTHQEKLSSQAASTNTLESDVLANGLLEQGGQAIAQRDIQAGTLRLLRVKSLQNSHIHNAQECQKTNENTTSTDPQTGYIIEMLVRCERSDVLIKAVESYNQTMLTWYLQHKN